MLGKKLIAVAVAGVLSALAAPMATGATFDNRAAAAFTADPMLSLERSRSSIVDRLVVEYRGDLAGNNIAEAAFRDALMSLRIDRLLAASLSNSLKDVTAIVAAPTYESTTLSRYVAVAPTSTLAALPEADAYLVRSGDSLSVVKAAQLQLGAGTQLVGYFAAAPAAGSSVTTVIAPKDGPGSGPNSWIGYTAGSNVASGNGSAVAAGTFNTASNTNSAVFAGQSNVASGISSLVIGGFDNQATAIDSIVGAGAGHRATGARSVIVGGGYNLASGQWSAIVGGGRQTGSGAAGSQVQDHIASGNFSFIGGGQGNRATGIYSTIGGGNRSIASGIYSTVAGGDFFNRGQVAGGNYSFVGGGADNQAMGLVSTIAGGDTNTAGPNSNTAFIGGGTQNTANGLRSTIVGGTLNSADGQYAAIPGGQSNSAGGNYSFAGGRRAKVAYLGAFSWADSTDLDFYAQAGEPGMTGVGWINAVNTFNVRATGGVWFVTAVNGTSGAPTAGAYLGPGSGTWSVTSDRNAKRDFAPVDPTDVLHKVVSMPISTWSYRTEQNVRHIGPMAQDFRRLFDVGTDERSITTVDADGVALAAIQGLYREVQARDKRIASLEKQVGELEVAQLQLQEIASVVGKLQQELASLRRTHDMAMAK